MVQVVQVMFWKMNGKLHLTPFVVAQGEGLEDGGFVRRPEIKDSVRNPKCIIFDLYYIEEEKISKKN